MAKGKKGKKGGKKSAAKKERVEFRRNRAAPGRENDWTRLARDAEDHEFDAKQSERITTKGDLSRKRTVSVNQDDGLPIGDDLMRSGKVITVYGRVAEVDDGERSWPCTIRRVLRTRSIKDRNAVTVGDWVRFSVLADREGVEAEGVIESVEPRRGELKRLAYRREQTVVANVDRAIIVASAREPEPKPQLIDRYIVAALYGEIEPVVCLNKVDLTDPESAEELLAIYKSLGYKTLATSATRGDGIEELRALLKDSESVVAGQSGVGKSSLLNAVQPDLALKIGRLAAETAKGSHTTTRASLIKLDGGGYVVDTPGVRSFDLSCVPRAELERLFVEFVEHVTHCKFADCTHVHEIDCAVHAAVESGAIHPSRYDSYVRLFMDVQYR
jgi:ribosome biogenesis GTPase / thiamine phosphate phosphatase